MPRNTHDRTLDHHGSDKDTNIVLDTAVGSTPAGSTLHAALVALAAGGSSGGGSGSVAGLIIASRAPSNGGTSSGDVLAPLSVWSSTLTGAYYVNLGTASTPNWALTPAYSANRPPTNGGGADTGYALGTIWIYTGYAAFVNTGTSASPHWTSDRATIQSACGFDIQTFNRAPTNGNASGAQNGIDSFGWQDTTPFTVGYWTYGGDTNLQHIPYNASLAQIQAAFEAVDGAGNVLITHVDPVYQYIWQRENIGKLAGLNPLNLTFLPGTLGRGAAWQPNHAYAAGTHVHPIGGGIGRDIVADTSFTSGSSEPTWDVGSVSDGGGSWTVSTMTPSEGIVQIAIPPTGADSGYSADTKWIDVAGADVYFNNGGQWWPDWGIDGTVSPHVTTRAPSNGVGADKAAFGSLWVYGALAYVNHGSFDNPNWVLTSVGEHDRPPYNAGTVPGDAGKVWFDLSGGHISVNQGTDVSPSWTQLV